MSSNKTKKVKELNKIKHIKAIARIYTSQMKLGEKVEKDKSKYTRKQKHKKNYKDDY